MQAPPLSTSAARNQIESSDPSSPTCNTFVSTLPFQPVSRNARPSLQAPSCIAHGSGLAHDAGNLLAALGLYSELLSRPGVLSPEHEHYAAELRGIAERGSSLMRSLIPHIRPAPVPGPTAPRQASVRTDLSTVLREMEPLLAAIAAPNATVVLEAPQSLPFEGVPTDCLERVLINLVRNSAQAIASSQVSAFGTVRIALAAHADHLRLTVEDDGPGMSVATTSAFLSPASLPPGATHGLGHRIVHDLVTSSGGKLTVRVRRGQGTSFTIQWPTDPLYSVDQPLSGTTASLAPSFVTGSHEVSAC